MVLGSAFYATFWGFSKDCRPGVQLLVGSGHALLLWPEAWLCEKVLGRVLMLMPGWRRELEKDFTTKDLLSFGWMIG